MHHLPHASIEQIYDRFLQLLTEIPAPLSDVDFKHYLLNFYKVRTLAVELALRQGGLHIKGELESTSVNTVTSARSRGWKILLAGLLLVALLAGIVPGDWYTPVYKILFPWQNRFGNRSDEHPLMEIMLEPRWEKKFLKETREITSYVSRAHQYIAATSTSLESYEMKTGQRTWLLEGVSALMLEPASRAPDLPLIAVQRLSEDQSLILRLAPQTGEVLWKSAIEGILPQIAFDEAMLIAYRGTALTAYTMEGRLVWDRRLTGQQPVDSVYMHSGILAAHYGEKEVMLWYLGRDSGKILWEATENEYTPGYQPEKDFQIFYTEAGEAIFLHVPDRKSLWDRPRAIGTVLAHTSSHASAQACFYTTTAAVQRDTGAIVFRYPDRTRYGGMSNDFLFLLQEINPEQSRLLLLDKYTGELKTYLQDRNWFSVVYVNETEADVYAAATLKPENPKKIEIQAELLRINKHTFDTTVIPVGKNLSSLQFQVFAQEQVVFIPSFQRIGGYMLPER